MARKSLIVIMALTAILASRLGVADDDVVIQAEDASHFSDRRGCFEIVQDPDALGGRALSLASKPGGGRGDLITWDIAVEKPGFYRVALRMRGNAEMPGHVREGWLYIRDGLGRVVDFYPNARAELSGKAGYLWVACPHVVYLTDWHSEGRYWGAGFNTLTVYPPGGPARFPVRAPIVVDAIRLSRCTNTSFNPRTYRVPERRTIRPEYGLCTHERKSTVELPHIARTGAGWVRLHFTWREVESSKGRLEFNKTMQAYVDALTACGLRLLHVLAYDHPAYDTRKPARAFAQYVGQGPEFVAGFARYCAFMARRLGSRGTGQVTHWEIWNEENAGNPRDYVALLKAASQAIKHLSS